MLYSQNSIETYTYTHKTYSFLQELSGIENDLENFQTDISNDLEFIMRTRGVPFVAITEIIN